MCTKGARGKHRFETALGTQTSQTAKALCTVVEMYSQITRDGSTEAGVNEKNKEPYVE